MKKLQISLKLIITTLMLVYLSPSMAQYQENNGIVEAFKNKVDESIDDLEKPSSSDFPLFELSQNGIIIPDFANYTPQEWIGLPISGNGEEVIFTITNVGLADMNYNGLVYFGDAQNDYTIVSGESGITLQPEASTDIIMSFSPSVSGERAVTFWFSHRNGFPDTDHEVYITGTSYPTLQINSISNSIDEGDSLVFNATLDSPALTDILINYTISGDVDVEDFTSSSLSGQTFINEGDIEVIIDFPTLEDSILENIESIYINVSSTNTDVFLPDTLIEVGSIYGQLIFDNDFEQAQIVLLLSKLTKFITTKHPKPIYNKTNKSIEFLDSEWVLLNDTPDWTLIVYWLNAVLKQERPREDWDNDNLINEIDENPFGFYKSKIGSKIQER